MKWQIVEIRPGVYAVRQGGRLWGWNYVRDSKDAEIWEFSSVGEAEKWIDAQRDRDQPHRVVKEIG